MLGPGAVVAARSMIDSSKATLASAIRTAAKTPLAWILGLQLLLALPFIGQPIHQDDHIYVDIGRNALVSPAHAHNFPYCFEGACVPDMASHSHPPFVGYWIGLLLFLFGDSGQVNVTLHLGFLVFPLLFAAGMYRLALRFTWSPLLATLVAITSPAAMVISHNLMSNYPTMALWTFGLALYVDGVDRNQTTRVWISGIFLSLAAFSSYPALMAVGICWIYALLRKSRMPAAYWAPGLAVAWMATWLTYSSLYFDRFVLGGTANYFLEDKASLGVAAITGKLLGIPILLAGVLVLPLPLIRRALVWRSGLPALAWLIISAYLQYNAEGYMIWEQALVTFFLAVGGCILIGTALCFYESLTQTDAPELRRDGLFLTAWIAGMIGAMLFVYSYASARYILPLLPPVVLMAFLKLPRLDRPRIGRPNLAALSFALLLGLTLSLADFATASVYREIGQDLGESLDGWESQTRFGGEWGFRHYMLEQGFGQFVSASDDLTGGQFVITPHQAVPYTLPQDVGTMLVPVQQRTWPSGIPIQLMNRAAHAGFYSSAWGLLPFSFSRSPVEGVTIQQVNYLVEKLPEIIFEHNDPQATPIPRPGANGGVELLVPVPSTLSIPYGGPWPAQVSFSCRWSNGESTPQCPISAYYDRAGDRSELNLQFVGALDNGGPTESMLQLDLVDRGPGRIVIEMDQPEGSVPGNQAVIGNWLVLPPGGLQ